MRVAPSVCLLVLSGVAVPAQQQTPPVFRASANLVTQVVVVTDSQGRPVRGLTARDFILTEDGRPQTVVFADFEGVDTTRLPPITTSLSPVVVAPDIPPVPTAASTAETAKYRGRRLLVFYFDVVRMPFFDRERAFAGAVDYINRHMAAGDMVSVMTFAGRGVNVHLDFTADRAALIEELDRLQLILQDPDGIFGSLETGPAAFGEDDGTFNLFAVDRQLSALQTAVTDLGSVPQVKTLVYFGSGLGSAGLENLAQLRATVNAAVRAHVTLNPVDARGLEATAPMGNASRPSSGGIGMFSGLIAQGMVSRGDRERDVLYSMARDTGGRAIFDNNDLGLGLADMAGRVSGYYILGYYADNTSTDGKYRRIRVSLADGVRAELSYRQGYYGPKAYAAFNAFDRERQLAEALRFEDPITDIPIAMEWHYFQISAAEYFVPISVRMPGSDFARARPEGSSRVVIDFIAEIKDEYGTTMRNSRDKLEFGLDALQAERVAARPLQYETGFSLLPGNYVIKILARDTTTGRIGTYLRDFSIPNLARVVDRLPTSSVLLTQQLVESRDALFTVRQQIPADVANPLVQDGQRLVPGVTRTFTRERPLHVLLEAYPREPGPLVAWAAFYRDDQLAFQTRVQVIDQTTPGTRAAVPIRLVVPLASLTSGEYTCQVTVLSPAAGRATFWRAAVAIAAVRWPAGLRTSGSHLRHVQIWPVVSFSRTAPGRHRLRREAAAGRPRGDGGAAEERADDAGGRSPLIPVTGSAMEHVEGHGPFIASATSSGCASHESMVALQCSTSLALLLPDGSFQRRREVVDDSSGQRNPIGGCSGRGGAAAMPYFARGSADARSHRRRADGARRAAGGDGRPTSMCRWPTTARCSR